MGIREIWNKILNGTRAPKEYPMIGGYDGSVYHFNLESLSGYALLLDEEQAPARLIALADALAEFARVGTDVQKNALADVRICMNGFGSLA